MIAFVRDSFCVIITLKKVTAFLFKVNSFFPDSSKASIFGPPYLSRLVSLSPNIVSYPHQRPCSFLSNQCSVLFIGHFHPGASYPFHQCPHKPHPSFKVLRKSLLLWEVFISSCTLHSPLSSELLCYLEFVSQFRYLILQSLCFFCLSKKSKSLEDRDHIIFLLYSLLSMALFWACIHSFHVLS